jgi:hypothetical protein
MHDLWVSNSKLVDELLAFFGQDTESPSCLGGLEGSLKKHQVFLSDFK